jgi:ubiquinone/menaquinone biosynthesis C-methylase UbiE
MICQWLDFDPSLPDTIEGNFVDRAATKTRVEEYWFVRDLVAPLSPGKALDAATGYVENWHILPYILGDMGWNVETVDIDPRTLSMHPHPKVFRMLSDITDLPYPDEHFDLVTCISTLEHLTEPDRIQAGSELMRVLRPGGLLILTADNYAGVSPEALAHWAGIPYAGKAASESQTFPGGKRVAAFSIAKT